MNGGKCGLLDGDQKGWELAREVGGSLFAVLSRSQEASSAIMKLLW